MLSVGYISRLYSEIRLVAITIMPELSPRPDGTYCWFSDHYNHTTFPILLLIIFQIPRKEVQPFPSDNHYNYPCKNKVITAMRSVSL